MSTEITKQADQTRQAWVTAFCLLYQEKPFSKISVQAVAKKAGYDRTTFYQYFIDLRDLLDQLEEELMGYITTRRPSITAETNEYHFINALVDLYQERSVEVNALLGPYGRDHFSTALKSSLDLSLFHLRNDEANQYEPYLVEFRLAGALDLFSLWLSRGQDLSVPELVELVVKLYQTNPGLKELAKQ